MFVLLALPLLPLLAAEPPMPVTCDEATAEVAASAPPSDALHQFVRLPELPAAAQLAAIDAARASGHVCFALPGSDRPIVLTTLTDLPGDASATGQAWVEVAPLVGWLDAGSVTLARWPGDGVTIPANDTSIDPIVGLHRRLLPQRRTAVLHLADGTTAAELSSLADLVVRRGFTALALHTGRSSWRPRPRPAPAPGGWRDLPVVSTWAVVFQEDGTIDMRFPNTAGRPLHTLAPEDILAYEEGCWSDVCDLVAVTAGERFLVARRQMAPAADLTRRWLFGIPVLPYEGPKLASRTPPTVTGDLSPLPVIRYFRRTGEPEVGAGHLDIVGAVDHIRVVALLDDREKVFRHCFVEQVSARRSTSLARDPFGVIRFAIEVDPLGFVTSLEVVESTVANERLQACVVEAVQATRFPRSADGKPLKIRYSHRFFERG